MNEQINEMDYVGPPAAPGLPLPEKPLMWNLA